MRDDLHVRILFCSKFLWRSLPLPRPHPPPTKKVKSHQNPDKESTDCAKPESKSELKANILRLNYVFTCLALKVPGKKSNPSKKRVSRKIPDKENADRGMPKSKSKYTKCLQKELGAYF